MANFINFVAIFVVILIIGIIIASLLSIVPAVLFWMGWNFVVVTIFESAPHLEFWQSFLIAFVFVALFKRAE